MGIIQGTKRILKPLVDFPTWMGYRILVDNGKRVVSGVKDIFTPSEAERTETFEQATARLNLTEEYLALRQKTFLIFALLWAIAAIGAFIYAFFLFSHGGFKGGLLTFSLAFLAAVMAFRQHFWYFQVKNRLLGANFKLWLNSLLGTKK